MYFLVTFASLISIASAVEPGANKDCAGEMITPIILSRPLSNMMLDDMIRLTDILRLAGDGKLPRSGKEKIRERFVLALDRIAPSAHDENVLVLEKIEFGNYDVTNIYNQGPAQNRF